MKLEVSKADFPLFIEIALKDEGGEVPNPGSWAHDILGVDDPAEGLNGPQLTQGAQQHLYDLPPSLIGLGERTDLQALIDAAPAGHILNLPPAIYRCSAVIDKPLKVHGVWKASIRCSDDWSDGGSAGNTWTAAGGAWTSSLDVPDWTPEVLQPFQATDAWKAGRPWIVMIDGVRQFIEPGTGVPSAGHFRLDGLHVVLPTDPTGHLIEVTTRTRWLEITSDDVILEDVDFRHAPSGLARWNAVECNGHTVQYLNCMFSWCHGYGPGAGGSTGFRVEGCVFANCGVGGLGGPAMNTSLFRNNVLFNNGFGEGWDVTNGSGGIKIVSSNGARFQNNAAFNNSFAGLWTDIECVNTMFKDNVCWDNGGMQLHYEVCQGATIEGNVVFRTQHFLQPTERTIGIYISTSSNVRIRENLAMHLPSGYEIRWTVRADEPVTSPTSIRHSDNVFVGRFNPPDQSGNWGGDFGLVWVDSTHGSLINTPTNTAYDNAYAWPGPEPSPRWAYSEGNTDVFLYTLAQLLVLNSGNIKIGEGAGYLADNGASLLSKFGLS